MTEEHNTEAVIESLRVLQFGGDEHLGFTTTHEGGASLTHAELCSYLYSASCALRHFTSTEEELRRELGSTRESLRLAQIDVAAKSDEILAARTELAEFRDDHALVVDSQAVMNTNLFEARRDLGIIAEALREEATKREWCSEYEDFVNRVNHMTTGNHLVPCWVNRSLTFTVRVNFTASRDQVGTLEEELREQMRDLSLDGVEDLNVDVAVTRG